MFTCTFTQDKSFANIYTIGETKVSVIEQCCYPCHAGVLFVNLHDNEKTSVKAAEQYLNEIGGRLINIQNNGERLINFKHKGRTYTFDPNRIYSAAGIDSTITILSSRYNANAAKEVSKFAKSLITNYIDSSNLIISLHNNRDSSLSVLTYTNDSDINKSFGTAFINPDMDIDDFILTTDTSLFNRIKAKNINVVWENVDAIKDDGSLSIYAARNNIPYINVEAEHEHSEEQLRMLMILEDIINEYRQNEGDKIKKEKRLNNLCKTKNPFGFVNQRDKKLPTHKPDSVLGYHLSAMVITDTPVSAYPGWRCFLADSNEQFSNQSYTWHFSIQGLPAPFITQWYRRLLPYIFTFSPARRGSYFLWHYLLPC